MPAQYLRQSECGVRGGVGRQARVRHAAPEGQHRLGGGRRVQRQLLREEGAELPHGRRLVSENVEVRGSKSRFWRKRVHGYII